MNKNLLLAACLSVLLPGVSPVAAQDINRTVDWVPAGPNQTCPQVCQNSGAYPDAVVSTSDKSRNPAWDYFVCIDARLGRPGWNVPAWTGGPTACGTASGGREHDNPIGWCLCSDGWVPQAD